MPVPISNRFRQMQQTGRTAETIVLTAAAKAADHLPRLIEEARGPVTGGLFPGLPDIEPTPGRKPQEEQPYVKIQYQVAPHHAATLDDLASRHNLPTAVLVRISLGHYFGIPVRLNQRK